MTNKKDTTLDSILVRIGEFGRYQSFIFALFCIAVTLHSMVHIAFVFTAADIDYRCEIPECDSQTNPIYEPSWIKNAVPYKENKPAKCDKYYLIKSNTTECAPEDFDKTQIEKCDEFVYATEEITIVNDFEIYCEENLWKLTLVGTINNVGQFVGLPISGILSDRYGRRTVMVMGMVLCAFAGIARSFVTSYAWFLFLEFLDAAFGAGTYACGFILGVELVGPTKRVLSGAIISSTYAVGEVTVALLAMWLQSWRPLLLASYIPPLFLISYFWLTPESVRWLLSQNKIKEAQEILRKAARINKKTIPQDAIDKLGVAEDDAPIETYPLKKVFKSTPLMLRFINCCFCWITCTFLFYGLTLNSVALDGNKYVDFILTALIEIPAYFSTVYTVDRWGRRTSQCVSYLLTGICCLASIFTNQDLYWLQLTTYLTGKFGATSAFNIVYIFTSEMFPTPLRHSLLGTCSMIGRIGSMLSPQMPLLANIWKPLPLLLFGIMGTIAGLLSFLFPETLGTKLPDTIEEAENIGKQTIKTKF